MVKRDDPREERAALPTRPPKGTRDFYPEDMRLRNWLFGHFREVARSFGFEEVDAPIVEDAALYKRKAGEEIVEQLYHFEMHGRQLALRGEITPSIARMVMARQGALRFPLRWFSIPQCWRYERVQRGRRREHFQWNMDIWGEPGVSAEAELIAAICALLDRLGLGPNGVKVRISSRKLLEELFFREGRDHERRASFDRLCIVIDKLNKIGRDAVVEQILTVPLPIGANRITEREAEQLVDFIEVSDLDEAKELLGKPSSRALSDLRDLFDLLDDYGLRDRVVFDASIVRGLAYYTGIVFEAVDAQAKLRSICGGGRYDRLLETLGGRPLPAVGFGFGDAVIMELLAEKKLLPELQRALDDVVVALGGAPERRKAVLLATRLRAGGAVVDLALRPAKLRRAMADADRSGAARVHLIGPDELARGVAKVRDLRTGEERDEPLPD